jgi:hypothetical protein
LSKDNRRELVRDKLEPNGGAYEAPTPASQTARAIARATQSAAADPSRASFIARAAS